MKKSSPAYRVFLKKRPDASGMLPVIIRVSFNGTVERALGFSVKESWFDKSKQRIRPSAPNAKMLNASIEAFIQNWEKERIALDVKNVSYTAHTLSNIIELAKSPAPSEITMRKCLEKYLTLRCCSKRSSVLYSSLVNRVYEVFSDVRMRDVDSGWMTRLTSGLSKQGKSNATISEVIGVVCSLVNFSVEQGWTANDLSVFKTFRRRFRYSRINERIVLNERQVRTLREWLFSRLFSNWEQILRSEWYDAVEPVWMDGMKERLLTPSSDELTIAFCMFMYYFAGIAPVDLCGLKVGEIKIGEGRLSLTKPRRKTGVKFHVSRTYSLVLRCLVEPFLEGKSKDDYFLPVLSHYTAKDAVNAFCYRGKMRISSVADAINAELKDKKADKDEFIPEGISFYCFRHSFATNFLRNSGNINALASAMGRSANNIATYVHELTSEVEMASELDKVV